MGDRRNGRRPGLDTPLVHTSRRGPHEDALLAVRRLIEAIGEDPDREGLLDTPKRVVRALLELTSGYGEDPGQVLGRVFHEKHKGMVLVADIPFASLCEHHLLPVEGKASIAYVPDGKILGLSKLSRVVQTFARRLQLQERMTEQIADAIHSRADPRGVAVHIAARHACMGLRGVRTPAPMITTCYLGEMDEAERREEFFHLMQKE